MGAYLCKAFNSLFRTSKAHAVAINPGKSTVSRQAVPLALKLTRLLVYLLNKISPVLAGRWVERLWFSAQRYQEPRREIKWRERARQVKLMSPQGGELAVYIWGQQGPAVLLVHGWSGRGTQMAAFAQPLQQAGYRVIAFDAPAHGNSSGKTTNIFEIIDALHLVEKEYGPFTAVVAHSFGSMVLARALRDGLATNRAVCISPPARLQFIIDVYCHTLRVPQAARQYFIKRLEQRFGADVYDVISADCNARAISTPVLIIHDEDDREVPVQQGKLLSDAWRGAELVITHGLGHRRILRDQKTIAKVVDYIQGSPQS